MLPPERRQVGEQGIGDHLAASSHSPEGATKIHGIPERDRGRDQRETAGLKPAVAEAAHPERLRKLAREGARFTAQHLRSLSPPPVRLAGENRPFSLWRLHGALWTALIGVRLSEMARISPRLTLCCT